MRRTARPKTTDLDAVDDPPGQLAFDLLAEVSWHVWFTSLPRFEGQS